MTTVTTSHATPEAFYADLTTRNRGFVSDAAQDRLGLRRPGSTISLGGDSAVTLQNSLPTSPTANRALCAVRPSIPDRRPATARR